MVKRHRVRGVTRPAGMPGRPAPGRTAKLVGHAFNTALAEAGGSIPVWLVLSSLSATDWPTQADLAHSLGIEGATLTRHIDGLEEPAS